LERGTGRMDLMAEASSLSLAAEPLNALSRTGVAGRVAGSLTLAGTLDRPQGTLRLTANGLELTGRRLGESGAAQLAAAWDGERLTASGTLAGLLSFEGGGPLDRQHAAISLEVRSDRLGALAGLVSPRPLPDLTGSFAGSVALTADWSAGRYDLRAELPELALQYSGKQIANRQPIVLDLSPERLAIRSLYLGERGADSELFVTGSIGLGETVPLDLRVQSTVAASWAALFVPAGVQIAGSANLLAVVRGTAADPIVNGQGDLHASRLVVPNLPNALEDVEATFQFDRDRVSLAGLRARTAGGTLHATGALTWPSPGQALGYRIDLVAQGISLRFPEGFVSRGNAQISLIGSQGARQVQGSIRLERLIYLENVQVDATQLILRGLRRERLQVAPADSLLATTQLNIAISGPGALRISNNVADLRGDVNLTVLGTLAKPVLFGSAVLEPGGTLVYADNRYRVERGGLTFTNPNRIDPLIDLVLRTSVQSFEITLSLSGTLDRLNAKFSSNANLADLEILSLLAGGQRPQSEQAEARLLTSSGESQSTSQAAATSFLAGQATSALTSRVGRLFGLDRLRIAPVTPETGQSATGVALTVGKRLSKDVSVTYWNDPSSNRQNILQVEWQVAKSLKLLFTQITNQGYAVDAQWERRF
ncbi:MAG: translocation/assembly module TamB, partial [Acidobacteriota bacterium]|nr:translocation/assembly module TamB [Acidobacteriota bacterium]